MALFQADVLRCFTDFSYTQQYRMEVFIIIMEWCTNLILFSFFFCFSKVRLRLGLKVQDLADCFGIYPSTVSQIFITWINLMDVTLYDLPLWLSRRRVNKLMPACFKKWFPTTRVVIDCTEMYINTPSSLTRQSPTWSEHESYK